MVEALTLSKLGAKVLCGFPVGYPWGLNFAAHFLGGVVSFLWLMDSPNWAASRTCSQGSALEALRRSRVDLF